MTEDDAARPARLRAEVAALGSEAGARRGGWWRVPVVGVCLALLLLAAPLAVVATWAHDQVGDTDRYVETVAPLADDPTIQAAVTDRLTTEIVSRLDIRGVTQEAVDALADQGIPPGVAASLHALATPLVSGVESFVGAQVGNLVRSEEFSAAWTTANQQAHGQLLALLTGDEGEAVELEGTAVRLNLAVLIDTVQTRLVDRGFTLADRLPTINAQLTIFESTDLQRAQTGFRLLSALARVLPVLALLLLAGAVLASRDRRHGLVVAALVVAVSMLALGLALNGFRVVYLDSFPPDQLPPDAAAVLYDTLVRFIRNRLRVLIVLFLAVAAVAWVTGPSAAGPVGAFLRRSRGPIRGLVGGATILVYVMAEHPTGAWTLAVLLVAAVVLLVVELLARPPASGAVTPATPPA